MLRQKTKRREQKIGCNKEKYVAKEFRAAENDKFCCNKVFMSRHKTPMSRHKLDNFSKTWSRQKNNVTTEAKKKTRKYTAIENYMPRQDAGR